MNLDPSDFLPAPSMTGPQVAEAAGIDLETARRFWRALGFPDVDDDEVAFDDGELSALETLVTLNRMGFEVEDLIAMSRVYGQAISRVADAETRLFQKRFLPDGETPDTEELERVIPNLLDMVGVPFDHVHRRHLAAAFRRLVETDDGDRTLTAVGFADLVDFSAVANDLPGEDLSDLVERFEDLAIRVCSDSGVRMVKTIGDAVMFVSPDADRALEAARAIVSGAEEDDSMPLARAGLDHGETVPFNGDYYGPSVNVAARITAFALPSTVVASKAFLEKMSGSFDTSRIGRKRLKGVGEVSLYKVKEPLQP